MRASKCSVSCAHNVKCALEVKCNHGMSLYIKVGIIGGDNGKSQGHTSLISPVLLSLKKKKAYFQKERGWITQSTAQYSIIVVSRCQSVCNMPEIILCLSLRLSQGKRKE